MDSNVYSPEHEPCHICRECSEEYTKPRYPLLRSIISCYKLLAWVVLAGAFMVSIFTGYIFDLKQAVPVILLALFSGITGFISLLAVGEAIMVFLDIEENTRLMSLKSPATSKL